MVKNKDLQEERMRGYFIQATKDILKSEGIKRLSVRNIADQAGYSFATIYNYFRDVNELVFLCAADFLKECQEFVKNHTKNEEGLSGLKATAKAYAGYFIEYPGVFELFFIERIGDLGHKKATLALIAHSFDTIIAEPLKVCVDNDLYSREQALEIQSQLKYSITGLLLMYLNRMTPDTYDEFIKKLDQQIDMITA